MAEYQRNRECRCMRCCAAGYMGPAVLVTLGVLFLIGEFSRYDFGATWPILLIVIGVVKLLQWTAPTTGHVVAAEITPSPDSAPGHGGEPPAAGTDEQVHHG